MTTTPVDEKRLEQFQSDVADLKIRSGGARGPGVWRVIGVVLMALGVIVAFVAYFTSTSQSDSRDIQSSLILAVCFVGVAIVGAAVFIAASVTATLRLWLLRQLYEGQSHAELIAAALRDRGA
ncbi:MAG: hypothetical protein ABI345_15800 [Jatrophihabitans sp.]